MQAMVTTVYLYYIYSYQILSIFREIITAQNQLKLSYHSLALDDLCIDDTSSALNFWFRLTISPSFTSFNAQDQQSIAMLVAKWLCKTWPMCKILNHSREKVDDG